MPVYLKYYYSHLIYPFVLIRWFGHLPATNSLQTVLFILCLPFMEFSSNVKNSISPGHMENLNTQADFAVIPASSRSVKKSCMGSPGPMPCGGILRSCGYVLFGIKSILQVRKFFLKTLFLHAPLLTCAGKNFTAAPGYNEDTRAMKNGCHASIVCPSLRAGIVTVSG